MMARFRSLRPRGENNEKKFNLRKLRGLMRLVSCLCLGACGSANAGTHQTTMSEGDFDDEAKAGDKPANDVEATGARSRSDASSASQQTAESAGGGIELSGTQDPLNQRPSMSPDAVVQHERGVQAAASGNQREAEQAFEQAVRIDTNAYASYYNLGVLSDRAGDSRRALQYYRRALSIIPDYEKAVAGIVAIYLRRNSVNEATAFIAPLASQHQNNLYVQVIYADVLIHAKRYADAWRIGRQVLRKNERFVPALVVFAKASLAQSRQELAISIVNQGLAIEPNHPELHYIKGEIKLVQGDPQEARKEFEKAVESQPSFTEARIALGEQYLNGANYDAALAQFLAAEQLAPELVSVHLLLGEAYRANRQWVKAKEAYDRARDLGGSIPELHFNLGLLYMTAGEEFPGLDTLAALQAARLEFRTYRDKLGPRLSRDDSSDQYLRELDRLIEREERRQAREAKQSTPQESS